MPSPAPPLRRLPRPAASEVPERVEDFLRGLGGAAWITAPGADPSRLRIVCTLLHGNEPSGVRALHAWLRKGTVPAVNAVLCVASVEAALTPPLFTHRQLPGGRDANRCFRPPYDGEAGARAEAFTTAFLEAAGSGRLEALIDLHNNSGHNPAYGVGHGLDAAQLNLTSLFADVYIESDLRLGALTEMTTRHCPSVAVECGRAQDPAADAVALAGLERFLAVPELRLDTTPPAHIRVYREPVRVRLRPGLRVAFAAAPVPGVHLTLHDDLDRHNLSPVAAGTEIGWLEEGAPWPFAACRQGGEEVSPELFAVTGGRVHVRRAMVPVMMTTDATIAKNDCLFYALEAFPAPTEP